MRGGRGLTKLSSITLIFDGWNSVSRLFFFFFFFLRLDFFPFSRRIWSSLARVVSSEKSDSTIVTRPGECVTNL